MHPESTHTVAGDRPSLCPRASACVHALPDPKLSFVRRADPCLSAARPQRALSARAFARRELRPPPASGTASGLSANLCSQTPRRASSPLARAAPRSPGRSWRATRARRGGPEQQRSAGGAAAPREARRPVRAALASPPAGTSCQRAASRARGSRAWAGTRSAGIRGAEIPFRRSPEPSRLQDWFLI